LFARALVVTGARDEVPWKGGKPASKLAGIFARQNIVDVEL
jgi:hypothetical protein